MSKFCSPLRYPGGKNCIFNFVSKMFTENELFGASYAEPYAGGSGLALRLLFNEYVSKIYINDYDLSIYAFWKTVTENSTLFCDWIEDVEISVDSWRYYKEIQKNRESADLFELAKSTFFLNRTNVSGVIKGGIIGGIEQQGKYKIDARFKKLDLIKRIEKIATFKHRINISNLDGLAFVKKMDNKKEDIFIYLDPPYFLKGADLYMNFYTKLDHKNLSKQVSKIKKKWMISYDNQEFILNLYAQHSKLLYQLSQNTSNRVGDEVLIFSDKLSYKDSINELKMPVLI